MADSAVWGIFLEVFEEIVQRCLEAGLVEGKRLTVDGTMVTANASPQCGTKPEQLGEVAKVSRTVREYLADLDGNNAGTLSARNASRSRTPEGSGLGTHPGVYALEARTE